VQWHPEFHDAQALGTFDDAPMLRDFLAAAQLARSSAAPAHLITS
jgi:hypothetical protein